MQHPGIDESMVWYRATAFAFGTPALLLGNHTVLFGEVGGAQAGISNAVSGRTTSAARGLGRNQNGLLNSLRLHGLRRTRINADTTRVLVHDGQALASVTESDGDAAPQRHEPAHADYAQRAIAAIPGLYSGTVTVGHARDGNTAVRRLLPTLNLAPFGAQAADLARTIVERECERQGVPTAPTPSEPQLQVELNDAVSADVAEALASASAHDAATYGDVKSTNGNVSFELHGSAHATAEVLSAIMRPGLLSYPPTVAKVVPITSPGSAH